MWLGYSNLNIEKSLYRCTISTIRNVCQRQHVCIDDCTSIYQILPWYKKNYYAKQWTSTCTMIYLFKKIVLIIINWVYPKGHMLHVQIEVASVENPIKNIDVLSIGKLRSACILYYSWYNSEIPSRVVRIYQNVCFFVSYRYLDNNNIPEMSL